MIPIIPDGEVKILQNVPFDSGYVHTCLFASELEQRTYMRLKAKVSLDSVSYARETAGSIKVQVRVEDLYNCNYMMFKNTAFENKWFYAFVTDVEYVNNITSRVFFEIDVMQTWLFDFTLGECFVEREHPVTDGIGENLVPENLEMGDYTTSVQRYLSVFEPDCYIIWATVNDNYADYNGGPIGNVYSGLCPIFKATPAAVTTWLQGLQGRTDAVIAVTPFKKLFFPTVPTSVVKQTESLHKNTIFYGSFDGYTPKNNKLYTSPYNLCYITNYNGGACALPVEYFSGDTVDLVYTCDISPSPKMCVVPSGYKGISGENWDEKFYLGTYPQLAFNTDAFKQWLALNGVSLAVNTVGGLAGLGNDLAKGVSTMQSGASQAEMGSRILATKGYGHGGAAMKSAGLATKAAGGAAVAMALANTLFQVGGAVATVYEHSLIPPQNKGSWGDTFLCAYDKIGGAVCRKNIRGEFARIIDNYFDMFGYATNKVKVPNISSRPHWNYIKTDYCMLRGNIPESAEEGIRAIFNKGITLWKSPGEIGNYSLDNSPT